MSEQSEPVQLPPNNATIAPAPAEPPTLDALGRRYPTRACSECAVGVLDAEGNHWIGPTQRECFKSVKAEGAREPAARPICRCGKLSTADELDHEAVFGHPYDPAPPVEPASADVRQAAERIVDNMEGGTQVEFSEDNGYRETLILNVESGLKLFIAALQAKLAQAEAERDEFKAELTISFTALKNAGLQMNPPEAVSGGIRNLAQAYWSAQDAAETLEARLATAEKALAAIAEGRGRFSLDNHEFAKNTIEDMKKLAVDALAELQQARSQS